MVKQSIKLKDTCIIQNMVVLIKKSIEYNVMYLVMKFKNFLTITFFKLPLQKNLVLIPLYCCSYRIFFKTHTTDTNVPCNTYTPSQAELQSKQNS